MESSLFHILLQVLNSTRVRVLGFTDSRFTYTNSRRSATYEDCCLWILSFFGAKGMEQIFAKFKLFTKWRGVYRYIYILDRFSLFVVFFSTCTLMIMFWYIHFFFNTMVRFRKINLYFPLSVEIFPRYP